MIEKRPVLVIARSFPPSVEAGGSIVAYNLFRRIEPLDFAVLRGRLQPEDPSLTLPVRTWVWDIWPHRYIYTRFSAILIPILLIKILMISMQVHPRCMLLFFPFDFFAVAGYLASRLLRLPFSVFLNDTWEESQAGMLQRWLAHIFEPRLLYEAENVFVISPALKKHFDQKYVLHCIPVLHPLPFERFIPLVRYTGEAKDIYRIVYTGNVSRLNLDSIKSLIQAVREIKTFRLEIEFYTGLSSEYLSRVLELKPLDAVKIHFVPSEAIPIIQRRADILFVGLAFSGLDEVTLATTFPTKFVEYLSAGQPILVHAPSQSYLAEFVRQNYCAELVDQPGADGLRKALLRIISQPQYTTNLVKQAVSLSKQFEDKDQVAILAKRMDMRSISSSLDLGG